MILWYTAASVAVMNSKLQGSNFHYESIMLKSSFFSFSNVIVGDEVRHVLCSLASCSEIMCPGEIRRGYDHTSFLFFNAFIYFTVSLIPSSSYIYDTGNGYPLFEGNK